MTIQKKVARKIIRKKATIRPAGQDPALKEFFGKIMMLQEEEKKRISRDLHDETGQIVVALGSSLGIIEKEIRSGNLDRALEVISENRRLIQEIAAGIKSMAVNLRPPALDILGLSAVLREYFSQCTKSNPVKISFNENLDEAKLSEDIEIGLYRIVQEAIFNVLKHSNATEVKVGLIIKDKKIILTVEDNGKGFDIAEYKSKADLRKIGLRGIRERVHAFEGAFHIESAVGKGTKINVTLPEMNKK